jgi:hypothetical protein
MRWSIRRKEQTHFDCFSAVSGTESRANVGNLTKKNLAVDGVVVHDQHTS